ncbi:MAG: tetratricopeptide repeat protein [Cyanobacteriota/Melainabacteria group bacterium]
MIRSHIIACLSFVVAGVLPLTAPALALDSQKDCDAIRAMATKRPNDLELRYRLAECYLNTGKVDAAKRELALCIKYGGKSPVAARAGKRLTELRETRGIDADIESRSELLSRLEAEKKQASQRFDLEIKAIERAPPVRRRKKDA